MWSVGVVMYILLSGYMPFPGKDFEEIFQKIRSGKIHFDYDEFKHVSQEGKDLIKKMIVVDLRSATLPARPSPTSGLRCMMGATSRQPAKSSKRISSSGLKSTEEFHI